MADMLKDGPTGPLNGPGEQLVVECLPTVMEQIHAEVAEAFYSAPRGGVETGGVLFGAHEGSRVVIFAARPLRCEHATGPSYVLSANDIARLSEMLQSRSRDSGLAGMSVVGWYHSHTRSEIDLTEADLEIHNRFFPEPWQVALVLRPATMRPTRVCFFFREANGGTRSTTFYAEATPPAVPTVPAAVDLPGFLSAPDPAPKGRRRWPLWSLIGAVVCLLAVAAGYVTKDYWMRQSSGPSSYSALHLQIVDRQGQLEVRWDAALPFVRDAQSGTLEFLDGSTRRFIMLDPRFLRAGSVTYARQSDTVRIQMTVEKANGSKLEELVSFLGQAPPGSPAPEPEEVRTQAGDSSKEAERVRAESERQALQKREAEQAFVQKRLAQLREEEAARLSAQKKTPPAPIVAPPKPVTTAAPSNTPPAAGKQLAAAVKPVSPPVRPEIPASKPATPAQQPAPRATPPPPSASQPPPAASKPVPAAKPELAVSKPVTQAQQPAPQAPPPTPPASQPPPAASKPVPVAKSEPAASKPVPAAKSEPAASKPVPVAQPEPAASKPVPPLAKPESVAVKPAAAPAAPISGEWTLMRSRASGSPFRPESVTLAISEEGNWVRGTLVGRYRAPKSSGFRPDVSFSFGGQLRSGSMKFPWGAGDGTKGEIEIIRVPNSSDSLEIVWYGADRKFVFDDIVVRAARR